MKIQDAFKQFLKQQFAPAMRELGFKGSGQKYNYPSDHSYIQIGIQKSAYSDSCEIRFTLNFQIIKIEEWKEECGLPEKLIKKPSPNIHERIGFTKRIGLMTPENLDKWWIYGIDARELNLLEEVTGIIKKYILPEIEKIQPNQALQTTSASARRLS